jgi:hypothetical protein
MSRPVATLLLWCLLAPGLAGAQARPDTVVVSNGDRLKGEIKSLSRGQLSFDSKATGVVSIKWDHVVELTSESLFEVETNDGVQVLGTLPAADPGTLAVDTWSGRRDLPLVAVVRIVPIRRSFLQRLDGSISLGGGYTQASGVAQLSFAFSMSARRPGHEWRISADDYVTFETDGETSQRVKASVGLSRDLTGLWAVFGGGQVERNQDLGFDLRATVGGGLERVLQRSNRSSLVVGAGLGASREVPVDGDSDTLMPALLTLRHAFYTYTTPKTSLENSFTAYPILNQAGRWRLEANASVSREIFKDFSVVFTFYESFDNRPPSEDASRNDAGVSLSIGYTF